MTKHDSLIFNAFTLFNDGNIVEGEQFMYDNNLDYLEISPNDKWSWLHKFLMSVSPMPKVSVNVIQFFIDKGVPVNGQDIYGMTPLHYAMRGCNAEAVICLLEAGADPNIPDIDNLRPLSMIGYFDNRLDILELMLKKGGNVHHFINEEETILDSWKPQDNSSQWEVDIYEMMKRYSGAKK